jgi:uncharacterized protein (TIGR02246 family)
MISFFSDSSQVSKRSQLKACVLLLLIASLGTLAQGSDNSVEFIYRPEVGARDKAEIQALLQRFDEAFNARDAEKVASLYLPDGDRINSDMEIAKGRAEIAAQYEKEFAREMADPSTVPVHTKITVRLLDPQVAILDGEEEGSRGGKKVRGQFTAVVKKGVNGWQVAAGRVRDIKEL